MEEKNEHYCLFFFGFFIIVSFHHRIFFRQCYVKDIISNSERNTGGKLVDSSNLTVNQNKQGKTINRVHLIIDISFCS